MSDLLVAALLGGALHFLIGGLWYSPLLFGQIWMRGLGLTPQDIEGGRISMVQALGTSALSSLIQTAALAWLFWSAGLTSVGAGALTGAVLSLALGGAPVLRERVWTDRPWPVVFVDLGHEAVAGTAAAALVAWWLVA